LFETDLNNAATGVLPPPREHIILKFLLEQVLGNKLIVQATELTG